MKPIETNKSLRRTQIFGFGSIFVMLGIFGAWTALADINGAVIAPATIIAESYSKKVQHLEGGNISRILVKDGELVQAGQDLVLLDPTETKAELGIVDGQLQEFLVKKSRLEAQRDGLSDMTLPNSVVSRENESSVAEIIKGQKRLLASIEGGAAGKRAQLNEQIVQLNNQISGLVAQLDSGQRQLTLIKSEADGLRKLQAQGLVPSSRVLAIDRETARIDGEQGQLLASRAAAEAQIGETKLKIIQVEEDLRNESLSELRDVDAKISELQGRHVAMEARMLHTTIKAPITGTIYQLNIHAEGAVVAPGQILMMIVPEGEDLVLQAQISPNDISHVHVGQAAKIRFNSFNSRVTSEVSGEVNQVATDTTRTDAQTPPFYAVRLIIAAKELEKLGDYKLKPDMSAEALIKTESRSPFFYLVKPLVDQFSHAMLTNGTNIN